MKQEEQPMAAHPPEEGALASSWMSASVRDGFTVVAVGDLILSDALCRRLEQSAPDLLALIRGADVAFGNFEGTAIDLRKFGGHPSALSGGSWLVSTPAVPADL